MPRKTPSSKISVRRDAIRTEKSTAGAKRRGNPERRGSMRAAGAAAKNPQIPPPAGYLTLDQAAALLGLASSSLRRWVYQGKIASFKPSHKKLFIPAAAVEKHRDQHTR